MLQFHGMPTSLRIDFGELLEPLVIVANEEQVVGKVHVLQRVAFGDVLDLVDGSPH